MEYFAGANTQKGFVSIFGEVFAQTERLYILKGSSGCGKSTFMRRVAGKAQKLGYETDLIYCSGDPDSLDGVIIPRLGIAVADGTAPHSMDTKYPCVRESIINLGDFWKEELLLPYRGEIIALTDKKSGYYGRAYEILRSYGEAADMKNRIMSCCTDKASLEKFAFKMADRLIGEKGRVNEIFASAFSYSGLKTIPSFGNVKTLYRLEGRCASPLLLALERIVREKGGRITVACSPLDRSVPEAIYFHGSDALVTLATPAPCLSVQTERTVSTARFGDKECLRTVRSRLNGLDKLMKELLASAQKELYLAREAHSQLEKIYIPAMDFTRLDEFTFNFLDRLFGE